MAGRANQGVPLTLLHEGEGHVVTVELKNGETYRGLLSEAEDTMNCQLKEGGEMLALYTVPSGLSLPLARQSTHIIIPIPPQQ